MALMEVTLITEYQNQRCINRWNYFATGTPAAVSKSFALSSAIGGVLGALQNQFPNGTLLNNIRVNVSIEVFFREILVRDVYSNTDFYTTPFPNTLAGNIPGKNLSPFSAYGFITNRTRSDIRRATKRFVGVVAGDVEDGGVIGATRLQGLQALANAMSAVLQYNDEGNTISFAPCVVQKERYIPEGSSRPAYRYYPTLALQQQRLMTGIVWQPYATVRSQTSRQYGRGN